ncbi:hypothetical protein L873DRAFT_1794703 [Choiromyces venosus 120613-1]|uniref:Uncharacterized protein n=1 Tax=Choiromyces venosus 120613-1 TaxID=1336337 RepID=A0A3N4J3B4_9PEZI|nr:hypothetical protein L873DRAFT_1794703 [Choiromyces venosus 120613-1]
MSTAEVPKTLHPAQDEIQKLLKDIADLLCPAHKHKINPLHVNPTETVIRHSMLIHCNPKDEIIWHVDMSRDTLVKMIRRCKIISTYQGLTTRSFVALCEWEGEQCEDILKLLASGHLQEGWWEVNGSRWRDSQRFNRGLVSNARPQGSGSHSYVAYPDISIYRDIPAGETKPHQ